MAFASGATDRSGVAIFCRNTAEAINHLAYRLRLGPDDVIVTIVAEDHANLLPWARVGRQRFVECGGGVLIGPPDSFSEGDPFLGGGAVDLADLDEVVCTDPPDREEAGSAATRPASTASASSQRPHQARTRRPVDDPDLSSLSRSQTSGAASVTVIEVYADIWCPFAHLGLRTVIQRRATFGRDDVPLRVRAWPLELINHGPLDPATTAIHVEELRTQVAPDLFAGFDPQQFPRTTLPALALVAAAYRDDDRTGETVSLALRDALFEHGQDISDPHVLARIADAHGLPSVGPADERQVLQDWEEGQSRGVKGSPHFFCGALESFCPSLSMARDESGHLHIHRDAEVLDSFLAECFSH